MGAKQNLATNRPSIQRVTNAKCDGQLQLTKTPGKIMQRRKRNDEQHDRQRMPTYHGHACADKCVGLHKSIRQSRLTTLTKEHDAQTIGNPQKWCTRVCENEVRHGTKRGIPSTDGHARASGTCHEAVGARRTTTKTAIQDK